MDESKVLRVVGLDEVVDSDAFRLSLLEAASALPAECDEPATPTTERP